MVDEAMAIWRNYDLEHLFGGALDGSGITFDSINRLVQEKVPESEQLDFKGKLPPGDVSPGKWSPAQEFAKDVSALANARGGVLLYGVEETNGVATKVGSLDADPEKEERKLRQALMNYQAPMASCDFVWAAAPQGATLLAVVIPPSSRSPHAVLDDVGKPTRLQYPLRHGTDTVYLSEHEVAARYRLRFLGQEDEQRRLNTVVDLGLEALERTTGLWMFAAITPEVPATGRLDRRKLEEVDKWQGESLLTSPLGRHLSVLGRGIAAPGRVTFTASAGTGHPDETEIQDGYVELHLDGSAFAATEIGRRTDDDETSRGIGERTLTDDSILLVDLVLQWAARETGTWGTASMIAGFTDAGSVRGVVNEPINLVSAEYGGLHRVPRTRSLKGRVRHSVVADLGSVDTAQRRLAVTYQVLAGLLQSFGWPEPMVIQPDGSLDAVDAYNSDRNSLLAWANRNDVDIRPSGQRK